MSTQVSHISNKHKSSQVVAQQEASLSQAGNVDKAGLSEFSALVEQIALSFNAIKSEADTSVSVAKGAAQKKKSEAKVAKTEQTTDNAAKKTATTETSSSKSAEMQNSDTDANQSVESDEQTSHDEESSEQSATGSEQKSSTDSATAMAASQVVKPEKEKSAEADESSDKEQADQEAEASEQAITAVGDATTSPGQTAQQEKTEEQDDVPETVVQDLINEEGAAKDELSLDSEQAQENSSTMNAQSDEDAISKPEVAAADIKPQEIAVDKKVETAKVELDNTQPVTAASEGKVEVVTMAEIPAAQVEFVAKKDSQEGARIDEALSAERMSVESQLASSEASSLIKSVKLENTKQANVFDTASAFSSASADYQSMLMTSLVKPVLESGLSRQTGSDSKSAQQTVAQVQQAAQSVNAALPKSADIQLKQEIAKAIKTGNTQRLTGVNTMEKVEAALKEAARSRDGSTLSFRLDPPSLGSVKVDVTLRDGALHARLVAEAPAVNALLRERSHELQSLLRKTGLDVDKVSVSVSSDAGTNGGFDASFANESGSDNARRQFASNGAALGKSTLEVSSVSGAASVNILDHWVA